MRRAHFKTPSLDEDVRWLLSRADSELLDVKLPTDPVQLTKYLRKRHSPRRSRLLAELHGLRRRGRVKFSSAARMFFTRVALEQATDERLAKYKASRFEEDVSVADLCCDVDG